MAIKGQKWKQNRSIKPEEFVRVFIQKDSYEEIAKHFNISVSCVKNRAYALKRSGVNINTKKMVRKSFFGIEKIDVDVLNRIIKKYNK